MLKRVRLWSVIFAGQIWHGCALGSIESIFYPLGGVVAGLKPGASIAISQKTSQDPTVFKETITNPGKYQTRASVMGNSRYKIWVTAQPTNDQFCMPCDVDTYESTGNCIAVPEITTIAHGDVETFIVRNHIQCTDAATDPSLYKQLFVAYQSYKASEATKNARIHADRSQKPKMPDAKLINKALSLSQRLRTDAVGSGPGTVGNHKLSHYFNVRGHTMPPKTAAQPKGTAPSSSTWMPLTIGTALIAAAFLLVTFHWVWAKVIKQTHQKLSETGILHTYEGDTDTDLDSTPTKRLGRDATNYQYQNTIAPEL